MHLSWWKQDDNMRKGEFVVIVDGATIDKKEQIITPEQEKILRYFVARMFD